MRSYRLLLLAFPVLLALSACQPSSDTAEDKPNSDPAEAGAAAIEQKANSEVQAKIREIEARAQSAAEQAPSADAASVKTRSEDTKALSATAATHPKKP